jgi:uncharacterized cupin superfamily protein
MSDRPTTIPPEAEMLDTPAGRRPAGAGWFVLNATDAVWSTAPGWGAVCTFEPDAPRFADLGINLHRLEPGDVSTMYHGEEVEENFLVLAGECVLIVEGQERRLRAWDFLHCPAWVHHAFVNDGDAPCTILMTGGRRPNQSERVEYVVDPVARRRGAGVATATASPDEAYAGTPDRNDEPYREGTLPGA